MNIAVSGLPGEGKFSRGQRVFSKYIVIWIFRGGKGHLYRPEEKLVWEARERKIVIIFCGQRRLISWRQRSWYVLHARSDLWAGRSNWGALERLLWPSICPREKCQRRPPEQKQSKMTVRVNFHKIFQEIILDGSFCQVKKTVFILWDNIIHILRKWQLITIIFLMKKAIGAKGTSLRSGGSRYKAWLYYILCHGR